MHVTIGFSLHCFFQALNTVRYFHRSLDRHFLYQLISQEHSSYSPIHPSYRTDPHRIRSRRYHFLLS